MKYRVKKQCAKRINSFYHNVVKKYKHAYSEELLHQNIDDAIDSIYQIERTRSSEFAITSGRKTSRSTKNA